jgi:GNAT superfamily N-acetyltransferase
MKAPPMKKTRGEYTLSWDPADQQPERIHAYLSRSYWAGGIPLEVVRRSLAGSLGFGIFAGGEQVAFARVITDGATFAYLCDVYVLEEFRGRGLAKWLLDEIVAHPQLRGLRRFLLFTRDAHALYARYGFAPLAQPRSAMEIRRPDPYQAPPAEG